MNASKHRGEDSDPHIQRARGRLLQSPQRSDDGIQQKQQDQRAVLVVMQLAITGFITHTADIVQPTSCSRTNSGLNFSKYLNLERVLSVMSTCFRPAMARSMPG